MNEPSYAEALAEAHRRISAYGSVMENPGVHQPVAVVKLNLSDADVSVLRRILRDWINEGFVPDNAGSRHWAETLLERLSRTST